MEDNLNYGKKAVDFQDLAIPALDHIDGLRIKALDPDEDFELESVSDDEEDLIIDNDDGEYVAGGAFSPGKVGRGMIGRIRIVKDAEHENSRETVMEVQYASQFYRFRD